MASLSILSILTPQRYLGLSELFNNTKFASYSGGTTIKGTTNLSREETSYICLHKKGCAFASSVVFVLLEQSRPRYEPKVG